MRAAPRIRLLMTTDAVGGVWTFAATLARELALQGNEILLVTLGKAPNDAQRAMVRDVPGVTLHETDLQLEWQDPSGSDMGRARKVLGQIAKAFAPDIIHLNGYREATFEWPAPVLVVAHSCVNTWADACDEVGAFAELAWHIYTANVANGLRSTDAWIAPTESFRHAIASRYGLPSQGFAIWNGVAKGAHEQPKSPVILSAGRVWDTAKNLSALISIASDSEWPIRIAGSSTTFDGSVARITPHCDYLGELSHAATLAEMQSAAIFVSPALYEPFGLSVLEAANAGCALLLSDIPSFRELWDGAALFVDPRDSHALLNALRSLCLDEGLRRSLQLAASERATRYPLSNTVKAYGALYVSLLNNRSHRPQLAMAEMSA